MVLEVGRRGAAGLRIIRNARDCSHVHGFGSVLEVPGNGAVGSRMIGNALDHNHFHGFGSGREGGGWLQNHKKCIGLSSFSCLWKKVGGGRLASES